VDPETDLGALAQALKSATQGQPLLTAALRAYLRQKLPEYMVPSALLVLEALPLTASGKVDRRALPAPEAPTDAERAAYVAPSSDLEHTLAEVWRQELRVEQVGRDDNFFDLGGTSLLATRVQVALQQKLGRELSLVALFTYPTVGTLAKHLSEQRDAPPALARVEGEAQRQKEGLGRLKRMAKRMKSDE
jgi:acyl carrier protein